MDDINKEKIDEFGCMYLKSIEKRASSALQVGVKWGQPSRGYLVHICCWWWLTCEIILLMHTSCSAHLVCKGKKYALVSVWFKISYRKWKIDQLKSIYYINTISFYSLPTYSSCAHMIFLIEICPNIPNWSQYWCCCRWF